MLDLDLQVRSSRVICHFSLFFIGHWSLVIVKTFSASLRRKKLSEKQIVCISKEETMSSLGSQWLRLRVGLLSLVVVMMAGGAVRAQETRSTLLGTVKDATGALVPGATVEITNSETNVTSTAITNNSGYYEVPYLLPGAYTLSAGMPGFKKYVRQGIALTVNSRINIDVTLEVGAASESVTVTSMLDRKSTRLNSSHITISYAVFCLKKKKK